MDAQHSIYPPEGLRKERWATSWRSAYLDSSNLASKIEFEVTNAPFEVTDAPFEATNVVKLISHRNVIKLISCQNGSVLPPAGLKRDPFHDFCRSRKIRRRLLRSMHSGITRVSYLLKLNLLPKEPIESFWDALWLGIRPLLCFTIESRRVV